MVYCLLLLLSEKNLDIGKKNIKINNIDFFII